jgi:hypothetical protein
MRHFRVIPAWLHDLAVGYLSLGAACASVLAVDVARHPQKMWIMNVVWPTVALFGTGAVAWQYFSYGRSTAEAQPRQTRTPFPLTVANGALHCGSGCVLGDVVAEWLVYLVPAVAVWCGWHSLFGDKIFATWVADYACAYVFGIAFQYFTIAPMRHVSLGQGLWAAIKADTLSLTAWQVGMYGFMALAHFYVFRTLLHARPAPDSVEFWFFMQLAMVCGFATAYPANLWLIRAGLKESM